MPDEREQPHSNRERKVAGRTKRRRYVQGTRAFTHAMTNRVASQAKRLKKLERRDER